MDKWNDEEYEQLQYLQKIQIEMFKKIQKKEKDAKQDISEPPEWGFQIDPKYQADWN